MKSLEPSFFSRREVAVVLGVTTRTVSRWDRAGKLRAVRLGYRTIRYSRDDVEALIAQATESGTCAAQTGSGRSSHRSSSALTTTTRVSATRKITNKNTSE